MGGEHQAENSELQFLDGSRSLEYCGRLGLKSVETLARGIHFLVTTDKDPFCGEVLSKDYYALSQLHHFKSE